MKTIHKCVYTLHKHISLYLWWNRTKLWVGRFICTHVSQCQYVYAGVSMCTRLCGVRVQIGGSVWVIYFSSIMFRKYLLLMQLFNLHKKLFDWNLRYYFICHNPISRSSDRRLSLEFFLRCSHCEFANCGEVRRGTYWRCIPARHVFCKLLWVWSQE